MDKRLAHNNTKPDYASTVMVRLVDEDVDVWRPVASRQLAVDRVRLDPDAEVPEDEVWEFRPGTIVRIEERDFEKGQGVCPVAIESLDR
ncbi:MAG: hypothetical protein AAF235_06040 [Planctomycetota bacterium]